MAEIDFYYCGSQAGMLALVHALPGAMVNRKDLSQSFILRTLPPTLLANWTELVPGPNYQNPHVLTGTVNGSNSAFALPTAPPATYMITVGGLILISGTDYTSVGTAITFTVAPTSTPVAYY